MSPRTRVRPLVAGTAAAAITAAVVVGTPLTALAAATPTPDPTTAPAPGAVVTGTVARHYVETAQFSGQAATDAPDLLTWVRPTTGEAVRVPTEALASLPVGTQVSITLGEPITDTAVTREHQAPARQVLAYHALSTAEPAPATITAPATTAPAVTTATGVPATNIVDIVLATPPGVSPDATTTAQLAAMVNGPVSQFWATQSNGQIQVAVGATHTWVPVADDCTDTYSLFTDAEQAVGFTPGPGKHLLIYVPNTAPGCSGGIGDISPGPTFGGDMWITDTTWALTAHEFGHNLGFNHSGALTCQGGQIETGNCLLDGYGDHYNVMGNPWNPGSLNAVQAVQMGFLPSAQVTSLTAGSGTSTYSLAPLSGPTGTKTIRLTAPSGEVYYLEYRAPSGADAYLGSSDYTVNPDALKPGVAIRRARLDNGADPYAAGTPLDSVLLDATPTSDATGMFADIDPTFPIGRPVTLPENSFTITVTGATATAATVKITAPATPTNLLGAKQQLASGKSLTSPNGQNRVTMQTDGNLVVYGPGGTVRWASNTSGFPGAHATMQSDGNLVVYGADGTVRWASGTNASTYTTDVSGDSSPQAMHLLLTDDGSLVLADLGGTPRWRNGAKVTDILAPARSLTTGRSLTSPNGAYRLAVQSDGNLVEYATDGRAVWATGTRGTNAHLDTGADGTVALLSGTTVLWTATTQAYGGSLMIHDDGSLAVYNPVGRPLWTTMPDARSTASSKQRLSAGAALTSPNGTYRAVMQNDGNFVVYQGATAVWATGTQQNAGASVVMQGDGNLVVYDTTGKALWASGTAGRAGAELLVTNTGALTVSIPGGAVLWTSR